MTQKLNEISLNFFVAKLFSFIILKYLELPFRHHYEYYTVSADDGFARKILSAMKGKYLETIKL